MAASILTATTPEQLAEQFPHTLRPFAVLYNDDPGCDSRKWAVNNENGETTQEFEDMATALKVAAEMGSEWDAEARKQAQALAEVIESNDAELLDIQARLVLMMSGKDDGAKNRIVKTIVCKMADSLVSASNYEDACTIANALRVSASANRYNPEEVGCDIWMVHAQSIATLATVDRMGEIEGVDASEEFPAVRAMLRDMKTKLEILASNVDVLKQPEAAHA